MIEGTDNRTEESQIKYYLINPLSGNAPWCTFFIILLCLMPDDFTRQVESAATQWVNDWYEVHPSTPHFHGWLEVMYHTWN
jgi:hypothetical protein